MCAVEDNYRIVVVGNDDRMQVLMQGLDDSGLRAERLGCGAGLLDDTHGEGSVDLVIVDAAEDEIAGRIRGLCLGRRLKSSPETVSIPVIAVGNSSQQRLDSFEIGVDEYFDTETPASEITLRVRSILRVSAARRAAVSLRLMAEQQRCKEIGDAFRRYVAPSLVDEILSRSQLRTQAPAKVSERMQATVLFADMRGFTRMSEQLSSYDVVPLLNEYFRLLTAIVAQYQGTVFSMAGDCLMVGFGVPNKQNDAPVRAFRAAKTMLESFSELAASWKQGYGIEVGLGIGINAGEVIAGNVGSPEYMNYTVIGDVVNVAARFSQRARAGEMLFSQKVKEALLACGENCKPVTMEPISLHGRAESIEIFCAPMRDRVDIPPEQGPRLAFAAAK